MFIQGPLKQFGQLTITHAIFYKGYSHKKIASHPRTKTSPERPTILCPLRSTHRPGAHFFQEKPKEKTIFNVKLESFDACSKPKVIKEVKAMVPNLTLIEVRPSRHRLHVRQGFSSTILVI